MPQCMCNMYRSCSAIIISDSVIPYFVHSTANNVNDVSLTGMKANPRPGRCQLCHLLIKKT